ncbi:hypothetical protein B0H11DRAFT_2230146 [Mycena galericulata]|nr:hypothetical protein B0H11DRAFT_2230146 [Mycena galericulata]
MASYSFPGARSLNSELNRKVLALDPTKSWTADWGEYDSTSPSHPPLPPAAPRTRPVNVQQHSHHQHDSRVADADAETQTQTLQQDGSQHGHNAFAGNGNGSVCAATSFSRFAFILPSTSSPFRSFTVEMSRETESLYDAHLPLVRVSTLSAAPSPIVRAATSFSQFAFILPVPSILIVLQPHSLPRRAACGIAMVQIRHSISGISVSDVPRLKFILLVILGYPDSALSSRAAPRLNVL